MSRRVLIVAYYFPPLGGIGSLRMLGHARHLPEHGWETLVLAPRAGAYHRDPELSFCEEHVVRTGSLELSRLGKRALRAGGDDATAAAGLSGARALLRRVARSALYFPDAQAGWIPFALRAGRRALRERPVEAVVSSSFPISAHVVGRRLARAAGVPWVADFRDPWSALQPAGPRRRLAARLERSLARDAAAVVMTSPTWAEQHARRWGRPVDVIPNGHDLAAAHATAPAAEPVLGYLGTYYPATQAPLGAVWAALAAAGAPAVREIRIIGELHPAMAASLGAHGLADRVRVTGFLPHAAAIEQLASCSVALLAGPADASGVLRGQIAGKVWEYLATDLPLLYVGPRDADVARLLADQAGTYLVEPGDEAATVAALLAATNRRHARDASAFSRRARARDLARVLDRASATTRK